MVTGYSSGHGQTPNRMMLQKVLRRTMRKMEGVWYDRRYWEGQKTFGFVGSE